MKPIILLALAAAAASGGCDQSEQLRSELEDLREARQDETTEAQDLRKQIAQLKAEVAQAQSQLDKANSGSSPKVLEQEKELRDELTASEKKLNKDEAAVGEAQRSLE